MTSRKGVRSHSLRSTANTAVGRKCTCSFQNVRPVRAKGGYVHVPPSSNVKVREGFNRPPKAHRRRKRSTLASSRRTSFIYVPLLEQYCPFNENVTLTRKKTRCMHTISHYRKIFPSLRWSTFTPGNARSLSMTHEHSLLTPKKVLSLLSLAPDMRCSHGRRSLSRKIYRRSGKSILIPPKKVRLVPQPLYNRARK